MVESFFYTQLDTSELPGRIGALGKSVFVNKQSASDLEVWGRRVWCV